MLFPQRCKGKDHMVTRKQSNNRADNAQTPGRLDNRAGGKRKPDNCAGNAQASKRKPDNRAGNTQTPGKPDSRAGNAWTHGKLENRANSTQVRKQPGERFGSTKVRDAEDRDAVGAAEHSPQKTYSVHELAQLSGVTIRALHHYDELGLVPAHRAANGYRYYDQAQIDRLQQVLLYRATDLPLADIKRLLDDPNFDTRAALKQHVQELYQRRRHIDTLIASVEKTLATLEGHEVMTNEEKFEAFKERAVEENEKNYGAEVRERWGDEMVDASNAKARGMTEQQYAHMKSLEVQIKEAILAGLEAQKGAGDQASEASKRVGDQASEAGKRAAQLHKQWLCMQWPDGVYSKEAHAGLAESYVADERFKAYYDAIAPGAAVFLRDAIQSFCAS